MMLRDQYDNTFTDIAKEYEISVGTVKEIYNKIKIKQTRMYITYISIVLGYENTLQIEKVYNDAYECYQDRVYACGYLEKKYKDILDEYRAGEPGMPIQFIKSMPPFKPKLSKKTVARVIEMHEAEKASFKAIGKELKMTQAKARYTYDWFYHEQVLELVRALQEKTESTKQKNDIWQYCFRGNKTPKKRYDELMKRNEN